MDEVFYLDYVKNCRKGVINEMDVMEVFFQKRLKKKSVPAVITALDFLGDGAVWVLTFPGLEGVRGLVPASEAGVDSRLMPRLIGMEVKVKVKGIDRENKLVACSIKEAFAEAVRKLQVNAVVEGTVLTVGAGGTLLVIANDALVEIEKNKARRVLSLPIYQQYLPGQKVEVRITEIDEVKAFGEVVISDPWLVADYKRGQFVSARVFKIKDGIVFLEPELTPGLLGIAPTPIEGGLERGDRVVAAVASFDASQKKLRFRIVRRLER